MTNFEKYLEDLYMETFPSTLDDDLPDATNNWIGGLDVEDIMTYAEDFGKSEYQRGLKEKIL
jgi:peroxiredoxin